MYIQYCEFRAPSAFQGKRKLLKTPECRKWIQYSEKFQGKLRFQGKRKLLKILNIKSIFTAVKIFRVTLFFFRASASCSKILNSQKYIQSSEKFQGQLCFQGKRKLLKILNMKSIFTTVKIFKATLFFFQGVRKLLKSCELWKNFQYSQGIFLRKMLGTRYKPVRTRFLWF